MSVDIRRSTELMLKARAPEMFAAFITTLCRDLGNIVKSNFGVFDKFTGDGVLAFFPDFYSGGDAGYWVIKAAHQCHESFSTRYKEFRSSFTTVLTSVGLGIGIDYGPAHLVQMAGGLTVVGAPVVYACRMAGAPAGSTFLNQLAYERISERYSPYCFLRETELDLKHEGPTLAYSVELSKGTYEPHPPEWARSSAA
jgi:adenylate cyclase